MTCVCGARLRPDDDWCSLCHAPVETAADERPVNPPTGWRPPSAEVVTAPERWSRTRGSEVTFGPVGRVVVTVLLLLPLIWLLWSMTVVGLVLYGLVLLPWALRDVWRKVRTDRG